MPLSTAPDRSEIGPYLGSPRTTSGWPKNPPHPRTFELGDFSESARSAGMEHRRAGPPQHRTARRSVPTSEVFGLHFRVLRTNSASPEHFRGGAISPKAPRLRAWIATDTDQRKDGPPQTWIATWPDMFTAPDRSEIGPYLKGSTATRRGRCVGCPTTRRLAFCN